MKTTHVLTGLKDISRDYNSWLDSVLYQRVYDKKIGCMHIIKNGCWIPLIQQGLMIRPEHYVCQQLPVHAGLDTSNCLQKKL
jgi:hypothetical protein